MILVDESRFQLPVIPVLAVISEIKLHIFTCMALLDCGVKGGGGFGFYSLTDKSFVIYFLFSM